MFDCRLLAASLAMTALSACSSLGLQYKLGKVEEGLANMSSYDKYEVLAWNKDTMPENKQSPLGYKTEIVADNCLTKYKIKSKALTSKLLSYKHGFGSKVYKSSIKQADFVEKEAQACANAYNADAHFRLLNSSTGYWIELDDWVRTLKAYHDNYDQAKADLAAAKQKEKATAAAVLGVIAIGAAAAAASYNTTGSSYTNPNKHWVNGYYRANGTYVPGHWRTNPNGVCYDNINGC